MGEAIAVSVSWCVLNVWIMDECLIRRSHQISHSQYVQKVVRTFDSNRLTNCNQHLTINKDAAEKRSVN
jgi:hypothetical protein